MNIIKLSTEYIIYLICRYYKKTESANFTELADSVFYSPVDSRIIPESNSIKRSKTAFSYTPCGHSHAKTICSPTNHSHIPRELPPQ